MRLEDTAGLLNKLMIALGFGSEGYIVQGGDVGSKVARVIAAEHDACKGMNTTLLRKNELSRLTCNISSAIHSKSESNRLWHSSLLTPAPSQLLHHAGTG